MYQVRRIIDYDDISALKAESQNEVEVEAQETNLLAENP